MIQWTLAGDHRSLGMIVQHTDADREFSYDHKSIVGALDKGIDDVERNGWHLIDIKKDCDLPPLTDHLTSPDAYRTARRVTTYPESKPRRIAPTPSNAVEDCLAPGLIFLLRDVALLRQIVQLLYPLLHCFPP